MREQPTLIPLADGSGCIGLCRQDPARPPLAALLAEVLTPHLFIRWLRTLPTDSHDFVWFTTRQPILQYLSGHCGVDDELVLIFRPWCLAYEDQWRADGRPPEEKEPPVLLPQWAVQLSESLWSQPPHHPWMTPHECIDIIQAVLAEDGS